MRKILIPVFIAVSLVNSAAAHTNYKEITKPTKVVITKKVKNEWAGKDPRIVVSVDKYSKQYKVSKYLVHAIIKTESNYIPTARSSHGAQGLMQLMPSTARARGCKNPYDIDDNIHAGTKHIAGLLAKYKGNEILAVAAYNAGGGSVDKYNGIPPYPATQQYVKRVIHTKNQLKQKGIRI